MKRDNGQGMFTMDFINEVSRIRRLEDAKVEIHKVIDASTATNDNKEKARSMVFKSTSVRGLLFGMVNFSLSHQGLGVSK